MHLFLNCLAASAGGGLTYVRNVVPHLANRAGVKSTLAVRSELAKEILAHPSLSIIKVHAPSAAGARFYWEQTRLPELIRRSEADVLISTGNFALRRSPIPQILLSGNSLYLSDTYSEDLLRRREYGMWIDNRVRSHLARRSVPWANCTAAPSKSFAEQLQKWAGHPVLSIYHGFDPELFEADNTPLSPDVQQILAGEAKLRLLFVSHYNYYRNFETLLKGVAILKNRADTRNVQLFLTCKFSTAENPGSFNPSSARTLVHSLGISENVVELGTIPYCQLHHLYRACDIYVTSAYTETFAHPLVEAMASGLPIVASDLPVHREIAGSAARYFAPFSAEELATQVAEVAQSYESRQRQMRAGLERSAAFSWRKHVDEILDLASSLSA